MARYDYQDPLDEIPELELLDNQSGHYRFSCAGIVRDKEAYARKFQDVSVHRFYLMRKRVNLRGVHGEERVIQRCKTVSLRLEREENLPRLGREICPYDAD